MSDDEGVPWCERHQAWHVGSCEARDAALSKRVTVEYACELRYSDGRTIIGQPSSLTFCRLTVKAQSSDKAQWEPQAVRVMQREIGEWRPLAAEEVA